MITPRFGRLLGSMFAASLAALVGCAGAKPPTETSGTGGDVSITPTPLCGPTANTGTAGGVDGILDRVAHVLDEGGPALGGERPQLDHVTVMHTGFRQALGQ